jgi:hypothetical protein
MKKRPSYKAIHNELVKIRPAFYSTRRIITISTRGSCVTFCNDLSVYRVFECNLLINNSERCVAIRAGLTIPGQDFRWGAQRKLALIFEHSFYVAPF